MQKPKGLFILSERHGLWDTLDLIYGPEQRAQIDEHVDIIGPRYSGTSIRENLEVLREVEVIFSGWGGPRMDEEFLRHAPNLKAVFYGAGSIKGIVSEAFWERGVIVTSSYAANAVPVAEFCLAQILFSLKLGWRYLRLTREEKTWAKPWRTPGAFGSKVGLVSLGMIGRLTLDLLKPFDLEILVYSTSLTPDKAAGMGVRLVSLEELFAESHVVSLHTPSLPSTQGMINGKLIRSMREDATFINTARGAVVNEPELVEALRDRPDLTALLDVTAPEPPVPGSPLYDLPNCLLTPHIAGSMDAECRRLGQYAVDEMKRFLQGEPLQWQITREMNERMA